MAVLCAYKPNSNIITIAYRFYKQSTELIIGLNNGPPSSSTFMYSKNLWYILHKILDHVVFGKDSSINKCLESS